MSILSLTLCLLSFVPTPITTTPLEDQLAERAAAGTGDVTAYRMLDAEGAKGFDCDVGWFFNDTDCWIVVEAVWECRDGEIIREDVFVPPGHKDGPSFTFIEGPWGCELVGWSIWDAGDCDPEIIDDPVFPCSWMFI